MYQHLLTLHPVEVAQSETVYACLMQHRSHPQSAQLHRLAQSRLAVKQRQHMQLQLLPMRRTNPAANPKRSSERSSERSQQHMLSTPLQLHRCQPAPARTPLGMQAALLSSSSNSSSLNSSRDPSSRSRSSHRSSSRTSSLCRSSIWTTAGVLT